jgi:ketosteroid isomerase-like protein
MKKSLTILFSLLFITTLVFAQDNENLKEKIQIMNDEMADLMLSGDETTIWNYYSEDVISMPSYQPMVKGLDACKASSEEMMNSGMKITAFKSTNTDLLVSGDFVIDIGTYEITMMLPQMGDMPYTDNGKYLTVWETQDDGALKVVAETWNTDHNPWTEMQETEGKGENMEMQEDKQMK